MKKGTKKEKNERQNEAAMLDLWDMSKHLLDIPNDPNNSIT